MALREIHIPFGPDKTGGGGFGALAHETDPDGVNDPFATPTPMDTSFTPDDSYRNGKEWSSWQDVPSIDPVPEPAYQDNSLNDTAAFSELVIQDDDDLKRGYEQDAYRAAYDDMSAESFSDSFEEEEDDHDAVSMSFAALKSSFGQSRELKVREREMEEFRTQLDSQRQELDDREYILTNYQMLVAEQSRIIEECTRQREADKDELAYVVAQLEQISVELENAQAYHATQMQPLQTEIGRANAAAEQAKNDERSRKSELNAVESEVRHAASANDAAVAQAKYDHIKQAYDHACAVSSEAQDHLNELKRVYDDAVHQIEQTEGPLKHAIEDLQHDEEELKTIITQLGEDMSVARKRLQYCEGVMQFPEETEKLRSSVAFDEQELQVMEEDYDDLNQQLELSKSQARKAKIALGLGVAVIVIFIIILLVIFL